MLGWISTEDGLPHVQRAKGDHVVKHSAPALHVVLVHPEIHWNTRTVGRTCLGVGAQLHLVEPLGFSLDAREVRRSGLDYWPRVNPCVWPDWASLEAALPEVGTPYLFSAEAHTLFWDARYEDPTWWCSERKAGPAARDPGPRGRGSRVPRGRRTRAHRRAAGTVSLKSAYYDRRRVELRVTIQAAPSIRGRRLAPGPRGRLTGKPSNTPQRADSVVAARLVARERPPELESSHFVMSLQASP